MITLSLSFNKFEKGHSFWKLNKSLLKDRTYVEEIKNVIKQTKIQYASETQNSNLPINDLPLNDLILNINDQLFFETLLMEVRGKTISYSSYLKIQAGKTETEILKERKRFEKKKKKKMPDTNYTELYLKRKL